MTRAAAIWTLLLLAAPFSLADGHMAMYMGVDVHTDGGAWQEVDGRLAQTDASAWLAGATVPMGIQGKAEYAFDVAYLGGLEDNAVGFGAIVPGFVMGLVWDPANLSGSGLHAQVYNAAGEIHEYAGIKYDFEIPAAMIAGITAEMATNTPLQVRIRIDSSNGNVWVKDPLDATTWWAFTLGQSLEGEGHNMIGVRTTSGAMSFGNFGASVGDLGATFEVFGNEPFAIVDRDERDIGTADSGAEVDRPNYEHGVRWKDVLAKEETSMIYEVIEALSDQLYLGDDPSISFPGANGYELLELSKAVHILGQYWNVIRANSDSLGKSVVDVYSGYLARFMEYSEFAAHSSSRHRALGEAKLEEMALIAKILHWIFHGERSSHNLKVATKLSDGTEICGLNVHGVPRLFYAERKHCGDECRLLKLSSPATGDPIALGYWTLWAMDGDTRVSEAEDFDLSDPPPDDDPTTRTILLYRSVAPEPCPGSGSVSVQ